VISLAGVAGYDDGRVACTDTEIILRSYYGPFISRRISYDAIHEVHEVPNRWKQRARGSGDFVHRLNWDPHRRRKDRALVIYLKNTTTPDRVSPLRTAGDTEVRIVKPVITPDDPEAVIAVLSAHGIRVTRYDEDPDE
jgi:hypothetical protein